MTHDLDYPYITNKRENDLGVVNPPPTSYILPQSTSPTRPQSTGRVKCSNTEIRVWTKVPQPIHVGDYIILRRILTHWHFTRYDRFRFVYQSGTQQNVIPIIDYRNGKTGIVYEYFVVKVTEEIPVSTNYRFRYAWITQTPYAENEAWMDFHFWSNRIKMVSGPL